MVLMLPITRCVLRRSHRRSPSASGRGGSLWMALTLLILLVLQPPASAAAEGATPSVATPSVTIEVSGVEPAVRKAVLASLTLYQEQNHPLLTAVRLRRLYRQATHEIQQTMEAFGFYQSRTESTLTQDESGVFEAHYTIEPGLPVRVIALMVEINGAASADPALQQWREDFPLPVGSVLQHALYERAKGDLLALLQRRGYFDAELQHHTIAVNPIANEATITLQIESGARYHFGAISYNPVPIDADLLRRYQPFTSGAPYHSEQLMALQSALSSSNYFSSARVTPQLAARSADQIPVAVELTMRPRNRYTVGAGYGTDTGARTRLGFERRWLNRHGHRLQFDITLSSILTEAEAVYQIPLARPESDMLAFRANLREERAADTFSRTESISASLTHHLAAWRRTLSLTLSDERYTVSRTDDSSLMLYPTMTLQRQQSDDRFFPLHGWSIGLVARTASEKFASATDMVQTELHGRYINSLNNHSRLLLRLDAAASWIPDFRSLPLSLRYFAGGDNSVRGYAYKSLGPTDETGAVVGGRNLLTMSAEVDYYLPWLNRRLGVALFTDMGNAYDDRRIQLAHSVGAGVRWRFPFGQLRADIAAAISEEETAWRFHLSIGADL